MKARTADSRRSCGARYGRSLVLGAGGLIFWAVLLCGRSSLAQPVAAPPAAPPAAPADANAPAVAPAPAEANAPASAPATGPATEPASQPATGPASQAATGPTTTPATGAAAGSSTEPAAPKPVFVGGKLVLNFQNASVRSILQYLSEAAGFTIIEVIPVEGRITVISRQPVSISEAVALLDTVLREKGYAAIRNDSVLKIVTSDMAKKELIPVRTGSDPNQMGKTDRVVTQIIPIKTVDATRLKGDLASVTPGSVDVATNALSNTLIMSGPEASIRRLAEIIRAIDVQSAADMAVKVFQLKYANATAVARLVTDIFKEDQTGSTSGGFGSSRTSTGGRGSRPGFPGVFGVVMGGPGGGASSDAGTRRVGKVTASADDRSNTLVVSAPTDMMEMIKSVIDEVDKNPLPPPQVFVYPLKNGVAADIASSLNAAFSGSGSTGSVARQTTGIGTGTTGFSSSGMGASGTSGRSGRSGSSGGSVGLGGTAFGSTGTTGTTGGRTTGTTGGRTGGFTGGARAGTGAIATPTDLIGQVSFVAEPDTNSLLVTVAPGNFDRVKAIIAELDRAVPQVLIKVLLAEVTHSDGLDLGVEFSGMNLRASGRGVQAVGSNFQVKGELARTDEAHGFVFQMNEENITAAIRALGNKTRLDVLSRPYILTGDNQLASIMVGEQVPVITSSSISGDTLQTLNTYTYYNVGIILNVTPHINPVGIVTLDVAPTISAREPKGSGVQITSGGIEAPAFTYRSASARVAIRDGMTIVIGGLMQDQNSDTVDKVPFLGDIPWLGLLFQHKVTVKTKTELLIFLTPHVAKQPDELKGMSEDEHRGAKIMQDTNDKGLLQEHLDGLNRGAATRPAGPTVEPPPVTTTPETKTDEQQLQEQLKEQQP